MSHLIIQHLQKTYKRHLAVKDISLDIHSNEIVGLLGPNGAGKTTAFYMSIGLIQHEKGDIILDDHKLNKLSLHERARLGITYLPQEPSIFRKLTVAENILAILELQKDLSKTEREKRLNELLDEFHLNDIQNHMGYSLSGGERRRVEIARCLATHPKFILFDEPFAGIDPITIVALKKIILHLRDQGIGILITDHNVRETLDICKRAYIVSHGQILCSGTAEEILKNETVRSTYLGDEFEL
jgi:lipopolysaccharide export system ATP-binding protein